MSDALEGSELSVALPTRTILTDSVYETVKELVMDQQLKPGARLNIYGLARRLKVSPTPLREALARLEADGLVLKEPLRGYSIAPLLDSGAFVQLYEVRSLLEPFAARRAAERRDEKLVADLEHAIADMRATLGSKSVREARTYHEYREFASQDASFHDAIAVSCGNVVLRDTLTRLRPHLHLYRLYFSLGIGIETVMEHERILNAIKSGHAGRAASEMRAHIDRSRQRLSPTSRQSGPASPEPQPRGARTASPRHEVAGERHYVTAGLPAHEVGTYRMD